METYLHSSIYLFFFKNKTVFFLGSFSAVQKMFFKAMSWGDRLEDGDL